MSFVAAGTYGCVFKPNLPCYKKINKPKGSRTISKVFRSEKEADKEKAINDILNKIDPNSEFTIPLYDSCILAKEQIKNKIEVLAKQYRQADEEELGFEIIYLYEQEALNCIVQFCESKGYLINGFPTQKRLIISEENQLRYNGMMIGVFELLADAKDMVNSVMLSINADQQFWLADAAMQATLLGRPTATSSDSIKTQVSGGSGDAAH